MIWWWCKVAKSSWRSELVCMNRLWKYDWNWPKSHHHVTNLPWEDFVVTSLCKMTISLWRQFPCGFWEKNRTKHAKKTWSQKGSARPALTGSRGLNDLLRPNVWFLFIQEKKCNRNISLLFGEKKTNWRSLLTKQTRIAIAHCRAFSDSSYTHRDYSLFQALFQDSTLTSD